MAGYSFSKAQRYAVYTAHREQCWMCDEPLALTECVVDHLLPERLSGSRELPSALAAFGLGADFKLNSYANWVPAHGRCNEKKGGRTFRPTPLIQNWLELAGERATRAEALELKFRSKRSLAMAIEQVEEANETGSLSEEDRNRLEAIIRQEHDENREPAERGKPFFLAPWLRVISEDHTGYLLQGPRMAGRRPKGDRLHASWDCPYCGPTGWNGTRCITCGRMIDPD